MTAGKHWGTGSRVIIVAGEIPRVDIRLGSLSGDEPTRGRASRAVSRGSCRLAPGPFATVWSSCPLILHIPLATSDENAENDQRHLQYDNSSVPAASWIALCLRCSHEVTMQETTRLNGPKGSRKARKSCPRGHDKATISSTDVGIGGFSHLSALEGPA